MASTQETTDTGTAPPVWRNPWVLAFLIGAAILTLLRPMLIHAPAPPPIRGELPEIRSTGGWSAASERGAPWLLLVGEAPCTGHCEVRAAVGHALGVRMAQAGPAGVRVVTLTQGELPDGFPNRQPIDRPTWDRLRAILEPLAPTTETDPGNASVEVPGPKPVSRPAPGDVAAWEDRVYLIDGAGRIRGAYDLRRPDVMDETWHRTRHVISEQNGG